MKKTILSIALAVLILLVGLCRLEENRRSQGRQRLEDSVRRTVAACYAAEGFYPPLVEYMEENWGLQYHKDRYVISYEIFASNLMPRVTVLEK